MCCDFSLVSAIGTVARGTNINWKELNGNFHCGDRADLSLVSSALPVFRQSNYCPTRLHQVISVEQTWRTMNERKMLLSLLWSLDDFYKPQQGHWENIFVVVRFSFLISPIRHINSWGCGGVWLPFLFSSPESNSTEYQHTEPPI